MILHLWVLSPTLDTRGSRRPNLKETPAVLRETWSLLETREAPMEPGVGLCGIPGILGGGCQRGLERRVVSVSEEVTLCCLNGQEGCWQGCGAIRTLVRWQWGWKWYTSMGHMTSKKKLKLESLMIQQSHFWVHIPKNSKWGLEEIIVHPYSQ